MRELNKLKQELLIMKTNNIKPNYAELARIHNCDYRTVKKYDNGYEGKPTTREKESKLDKYKDEIKSKLELPGSTIKGTYEFFKAKDNSIGNYSNFYKYSKNNNFKKKNNNSFHPRYETEFGKQLQFDWKEEIKMVNKYGELFEFNIFSSTLGASRLHVFIYSKFKTRIDVQRCLVKTFQYIGGLPEETLTDNMSSIVDTKKKEFYKEFKEFSKDIGFIPKKCKPRHAYTKGKDESCNRFMSWLIPYNGEFETEEELIKASKMANIHEFVNTLPEGYDTYIGERGVKLSGGQKQRISIARVFLKNPPILILDEATSALDNATERIIQESLEKLCAGRTTIVVAHRLSTIKNADEILVLGNAGIIEQGTHEELMVKQGEYSKLHKLATI